VDTHEGARLARDRHNLQHLKITGVSSPGGVRAV
jgi:hypothetical protein